jgi:hypothetical protein
MTLSRRTLLIVVVVIAVLAIVAISAFGRAVPAPVTPAVGVASPTPTTAVTTPSPTATAVPVLHVDSLAKITSTKALTVRSSPKSKGKDLTPLLESGSTVYVTAGPATVDGALWWQVQPDYPWGLFGWIRATSDAGQPNLAAFVPDCPSTDRLIDPADIEHLHAIVALACFGNRELTMDGDLTCSSGVRDGGVGGASWLNSYWWCLIGGRLAVNGPSIDALKTGTTPNGVDGRYRVTGHFDDPEARRCGLIGIGVNLDAPATPDPAAAIICRTMFVVTALTRPS